MASTKRPAKQSTTQPTPTLGATPRPLRRAVNARDKRVCVYCLGRKNIGVDHVVPRAKGGPHALFNCVNACISCNTAKGDWDLDLFCVRLEREGKGNAEVILARVLAALARPVTL